MHRFFSIPLAFRAVPLFILILALAGCGNTRPDYGSVSAEQIYAHGHQMLQQGNYNGAIYAFNALNSEYPLEHYSQQGTLELIYAQYEAGNPGLALAEVDRYLHFYANSAGAAYAYYMQGVLNFDAGRGFLQRYLPYDMSEHSPVSYQNAYLDFKTVVTDYPDSLYAKDARRRMMYLVNTLAQHQLNIIEYYQDMQAYVAVTAGARDIILHYPHTPAARQALLLMHKAYEKLGLTELAKSSESVIKANHLS